ncbi:putative mitochondrial protein AtMg00820 [Bidens hawaiensis]|uniref:putative mitochondrial protein AtMg00820 n=1 Tax=Bidens hawaiensis TaxID=980011 RepID=UPI00404A1D72
MKAIKKNHTCELVHLPQGANIVGLKLLYKTKTWPNGDIVKHKAMLVAKGYSQQHGIDYQETFSPVAMFDAIRVVLSIATRMGWPIHKLDVKSAFLNRILQKKYMCSNQRILELQARRRSFIS